MLNLRKHRRASDREGATGKVNAVPRVRVRVGLGLGLGLRLRLGLGSGLEEKCKG